MRRLLIDGETTKVSLYIYNVLRRKFDPTEARDWLQEINLFVLTEKNNLIAEVRPAGYIYKTILSKIIDNRNKNVIHAAAIANLQYLMRAYSSSISSTYADEACWDRVMASARDRAQTLTGNQRRDWEAMVKVVVDDNKCVKTWLMRRLNYFTFYRRRQTVEEFLKNSLLEALETIYP